jgi:phosphatidylinositol glycan class T
LNRILNKCRIFKKRFLVGHGHQKGGIVTKVFNNDPTNAINIVYFDVLPWFLRVYLHSLVIMDSSSGKKVDPLKLDFVPGVDRERPYSMELVLKV